MYAVQYIHTKAKEEIESRKKTTGVKKRRGIRSYGDDSTGFLLFENATGLMEIYGDGCF